MHVRTAPTPTPPPTAPASRPRPGPPPSTRIADLTPGEIDVITGYARGLTAEQIAAELTFTLQTVRTRTARAAFRVGIKGNRVAGLVHYAYSHGVLNATRLPFTKTLDRRLRDVLDCLADGLGDRAAAERLGLSRITVRGHRRTLYRVLDVTRFGTGAPGRAMSLSWELGLLGPHRPARADQPRPTQETTP